MLAPPYPSRRSGNSVRSYVTNHRYRTLESAPCATSQRTIHYNSTGDAPPTLSSLCENLGPNIVLGQTPHRKPRSGITDQSTAQPAAAKTWFGVAQRRGPQTARFSRGVGWSALQCVREISGFESTVEQQRPLLAAKRRKIAAHGASRGTKWEMIEPRRGER